MPTIEVSQEQADALAAGQNVTLVPAPPLTLKQYVIVADNGNVWITDPTSMRPATSLHGQRHAVSTRGTTCTLVAKGPHNAALGHRQSSVGCDGTLIEIPPTRFGA